MKYILTTLFFIVAFCGIAQKKKTVVPVVNAQRIEQRIRTLATYGKQPDGTTQRVAFTQADADGRAYIMSLMKNAGLEVSVDFAGNIIGKRKGKDSLKKPIAFGSHIDMVPNGGNYDGCVGSIAAIEVIELLNESNIITEHPLEVIIFSNEEGGVVGSRALAGHLKQEALNERTNSGLTIGEGVNFIGGNSNRIQEVKRMPGDLVAFLELHIEQGGILEKEKLNIGVVEGIVGIEWWDVTIEGFANHAGTTPMNMRQDALLAASKLIVAVNEIVTGTEGRQVGTVGRIKAEPGAPNVIPGKVVMSLELRDLSHEKIMSLFKKIEERASTIAAESSVKINFRQLSISTKPAIANSLIQEKIIASANEAGLTYRIMPSGAGHDAQEMSLLAPMGMIFIPSAGGISHSPKEFSTASDMANGTTVLLRTILKLDQAPVR